MGETTAIGWTQATWNPWYGCTKVSAGCDHCYMFRDMKRYGRDPETVTRSKTKFTDPLKWKDGRLIFTCSWSDWFHKDADAWRDEAWQIVRDTPHHTYQILTKRPGRIARHLPADWGEGYPNVWLGTSVENQDYVKRIRDLQTIPAAVHFLSAEPLLGPLNLTRIPFADFFRPENGGSILGAGGMYVNTLRGMGGSTVHHPIDWVIAGGESGVESRPCETDWLRSLRDQCASVGTAFFLKQLGGHPDARAHDKAQLDGVTHTAMPRPVPPSPADTLTGGGNG